MVGKVLTCRRVGCRASFKFYQERIRHEKKCTHAEASSSAGFVRTESGFTCSKCERSYNHQGSYSRHLKGMCHARKQRGSEPKYECPTCQKIFPRPSKLKRHQIVHEEKQLLVCPNCSQTFMTKYHFDKHNLNRCCIAEQDVDLAISHHEWASQLIHSLESGNMDSSGASNDPEIPSSNALFPFIAEEEQDTSADHHDVPRDAIITPINEAARSDDIITPNNDAPIQPNNDNSNTPQRTKYWRASKLRATLDSSLLETTPKRLKIMLGIDESPELVKLATMQSVELLSHAWISLATIEHLKTYKRKKGSSLIALAKEIYKVFEVKYLQDKPFFDNLLAKVGVHVENRGRVRRSVQVMIDNDFEIKKRVAWALTPHEKTMIHSEWIINSEPSVDTRDNRNVIKMAKSKFDVVYKDIDIPEELGLTVKDDTNKRGTRIVVAPRFIVKMTVRELISHVNRKYEKSFSYGTYLKYKPFFVGYPT